MVSVQYRSKIHFSLYPGPCSGSVVETAQLKEQSIKSWTKAQIGGTVSQVPAKAKSSTLVEEP